MKTRYLIFPLLLPLLALAGDEAPIAKAGRMAIAINDQASVAIPGPLGLTRSIPVVLDTTLQSLNAGIAIMFWTDLRADKVLSERLYTDTQDFQLRRVLADELKKVFAGTPAIPTDTPEIRAAITRAGINSPVKFVGDDIGPIENPGVSKSPYYAKWEKALLEELKKKNAADTLLVTNVLLWGIKRGGAECEAQSNDEAASRAFITGNISTLFSSKCARMVLVVNNRLVSVADGKLIKQYNSSYAIEGGSTEQFLRSSANRFEFDTHCAVKWYAENLKREMSGEERKEEFKCDLIET
jgi:hypothetical protein